MTSLELLLMAIPALVSSVGGVLAAVWKPTRATRGLIQHFAAGVVLAALAVELLPEIEREHAPPWVLAGSFALGSLVMYGLKLFTERLEEQAKHAGEAGGGKGLIIATFIDVAVDHRVRDARLEASLSLRAAGPTTRRAHRRRRSGAARACCARARGAG